MRGFLSREVVNTTRQIEIDIVRGLAVFFMVLVHVTGELLDASANETIFAKTIDFLGSIPAAPVFMFVMGIGFVYSKNQNPRKLLKRGLLIFALGYVLNFLRGFLPLLIGNQLEYYPLSYNGLKWYHFLVEVDILQFAGLAMVFISILKVLKIKEVFYPLIAVAAGLISPYLWATSTGNETVDIFVSNLFGGKEYTFHPLFSWIFYPLIGAFFGWFLIRTQNKSRFYLFSFLLSIFSIALVGVYYAMNPGLDLGVLGGDLYNYYHHGILSNVLFTAFVVGWIAIWYFAYNLIPVFIKERLVFWSNEVTVFYFVHWIILGWCSFLLFDTFNIMETVLVIIIMIFISDRTVDLYIKIKERLSEPNETDIPANFE